MPRVRKQQTASQKPVAPSKQVAAEEEPAVRGLSERAKAMVPMPYLSRLARARVRLRMPTSRWRALPDFLVIGAQRSGTSSLYKYLGQHPSIVPSLRKETEFFTARHSAGEAWYRAHFPLQARHDNLENGRQLTFEADPSYLFDPRAPLRAKTLVPEAKIVVLLRDPVARAVSHYNHNRRIGQETFSLSEALDLEDDRLRGEVERMWLDPFYPAKSYHRYSYMTRGIYVEQLERWLELFSADRIKVIHSDDLFTRPAEVYGDLLRFLDVPAWEPLTFTNFSSNGRPQFPNGKVGQALRQVARLSELFAPHNERLYQVTGRDFGW